MLAGRCQQEVTDMLFIMHLIITFVLLSELILALTFAVSSNQCRSRSAYLLIHVDVHTILSCSITAVNGLT